MAKYYCILFDADNTLLNFDAAENKALAETLVNYGIEPDAETVQTYRTINEELWRQLEKGQIKREKLMAERFTRFLKAVDAAGDGMEMNRFYLEQLSTHPDLMGPEVLDVLRELSEVATLAVVTNGFQKVQIRRLAESGVLNFMEDVFVSEKMDSEKPNRRIFDAALRALGVENREHVLMVGDGLSSDIQGGANAGHTIVNNYGKFALHTLPSGVFYNHTTSVIGNGVALNIPILMKEIKSITDRNVPMPKILVSDRAQMVMPYHILFDQYEEERLGGKSFGSTKSGIAPFYSDKYAKIGFQVSELFDEEHLKEKLASVCATKNVLLEHLYHKPLLNVDELFAELMKLIEELFKDEEILVNTSNL